MNNYSSPTTVHMRVKKFEIEVNLNKGDITQCEIVVDELEGEKFVAKAVFKVRLCPWDFQFSQPSRDFFIDLKVNGSGIFINLKWTWNSIMFQSNFEP